jgi:hypothetical protein
MFSTSFGRGKIQSTSRPEIKPVILISIGCLLGVVDFVWAGDHGFRVSVSGGRFGSDRLHRR